MLSHAREEGIIFIFIHREDSHKTNRIINKTIMTTAITQEKKSNSNIVKD